MSTVKIQQEEKTGYFIVRFWRVFLASALSVNDRWKCVKKNDTQCMGFFLLRCKHILHQKNHLLGSHFSVVILYWRVK